MCRGHRKNDVNDPRAICDGKGEPRLRVENEIALMSIRIRVSTDVTNFLKRLALRH